MKVEIWSDILCPFCYIGKRKFEAALSEFDGKDQVEIEWKSFQLDPNLVSNPDQNALEYLAASKGQTMEWAHQATEYVTNIAKGVGLEFHYDKAVVANSHDAHRLLHLAKSKGVANEVKHALLGAFFTTGQDIANHDVLIGIAEKAGLDATEVKAVLDSDQYVDAVAQDILTAREIGVQGVPFFVFDRKFAVSGAQEPAFFLKTMNKAAEVAAENS